MYFANSSNSQPAGSKKYRTVFARINFFNHFSKRAIHNQKVLPTILNIFQGFVGGLLVIAIATDPVQSQKNVAQPAPLDQKIPQTLNVATRASIPPFVFEENGKVEGFSIDLWRKIALELDVQYKLSKYPNVKELLTAVESSKADVGIAAISITSEREEKFDFSYPMFESGLQVMVRSSSNGGSGEPNLLKVIFSPALLQLFGIMVLIVFVPAHIVWFSERRHEDGMGISRAYLPGIFEACWWAAATLATQADSMPRSLSGRILAIIWMFTSVVFVAYFTAAVTTSLTVQQLQGNIKGPEDLPGKVVATTKGSTSAKYLLEENIQTLEFSGIDEAYSALLNSNADAVVFDSPVLLYYASRQGKGKVQIVGDIFRKENYGIVFPINSPLRKRVNNALLTLKENGVYQDLYKKWFIRE